MAQLVPVSKKVLKAAEWSPQESIRDAALREQKLLDDFRSRRKTGSVVNAVISFPHADSYAMYLVKKDKPLLLMHLPLGDAWQVDQATIRGLRLTDVERMVAWDDAMREQFEKKNQTPVTARRDNTSVSP